MALDDRKMAPPRFDVVSSYGRHQNSDQRITRLQHQEQAPFRMSIPPIQTPSSICLRPSEATHEFTASEEFYTIIGRGTLEWLEPFWEGTGEIHWSQSVRALEFAFWNADYCHSNGVVASASALLFKMKSTVANLRNLRSLDIRMMPRQSNERLLHTPGLDLPVLERLGLTAHFEGLGAFLSDIRCPTCHTVRIESTLDLDIEETLYEIVPQAIGSILTPIMQTLEKQLDSAPSLRYTASGGLKVDFGDIEVIDIGGTTVDRGMKILEPLLLALKNGFKRRSIRILADRETLAMVGFLVQKLDLATGGEPVKVEVLPNEQASIGNRATRLEHEAGIVFSGGTDVDARGK